MRASADGGQSWRLATRPPPRFKAVIAADPLQAGVFHALGGFRHKNAFVMKLPPSLDRIEYFSIYGGSELDHGRDVAVDSSGHAYLAGWTLSPDLPATDGGFQSSRPGPGSAFITRFSADGSRAERATYLGGSFFDHAKAVSLDPRGYVYAMGSTDIDGFPLVNAARRGDYPRPAHVTRGAFLTKLDRELQEAVYSTLLGAPEPFVVTQKLAADALGRAHVLRSTRAVDPPADGGGSFFGGSELTAIERFSAEGVPEEVLYFDGAAALALDSNDQLVVAGNGIAGLVPGRAARLPLDLGEASLRPPVPAAYLARAAPNRPAPYVEAVVNSASFRSGPASPGELVSLFGRDLGPESGAAFELIDGRLPRGLGGTQVVFGETPAPLLFSGAGQVNAATPFSLEPGGLVPVRVRRDGEESNLICQTIAAADPGVFTLNGMKVGDAAVLNQDGTINSPANPAVPGSIISIFATGGGKLTPPLEADEVAGLTLSRVPQSVRVELAGLSIGEAIYAGSAPGLVAGVLQVNVLIPRFGPERSIVDLIIVVGEMESGPLRAFVSIAGAPLEARIPQ